jgi:hypothetical protein
MRNLMEGMRAGDLEDLVLPLVSVDEYESKIDDTAVVIGFYVSEKSAADDLNRFLQRSPVEVLDTEVSPAPDAQGNFMVFVELLNNRQIAENITSLLDEASALTNVNNWNMSLRGMDGVVPFSAEQITSALERAPDPIEESVLNFLTKSDLADARFEAGVLVLETATGRMECTVVGYGKTDEVLAKARLSEEAISFRPQDTIVTTRLMRSLGRGWTVDRLCEYEFVQHTGLEAGLLLRRH